METYSLRDELQSFGMKKHGSCEAFKFDRKPLEASNPENSDLRLGIRSGIPDTPVWREIPRIAERPLKSRGIFGEEGITGRLLKCRSMETATR